MTQLSVPEHGLKLLELLDHPPASDDGNAKLKAVPAQAMLLELDDNVLHEILRSARHGGKGVNLAFGKSIVRIALFTQLLFTTCSETDIF